ncbi:putative HNH nuclease [Sinorhizobium phage phiM6]|nr:putative HNH nuclease [Sinorhizobium phage phiM6]
MVAKVLIGHLVYDIDEYGNITKLKGIGFLKCFPDKDGYLKIAITSGGRTHNEFLHRVVYRAFHGEIPEGMTVDHIDNDKTNNHKDNLQLLPADKNAVKGNAKTWNVTTPDGEVIEVYNLEEFCRERELHRGHMQAHTYKGWKARKCL